MQKQLFLIKTGHFSYIDVDTMPIYELDWFVTELHEQNKQKSGFEELEAELG